MAIELQRANCRPGRSLRRGGRIEPEVVRPARARHPSETGSRSSCRACSTSPVLGSSKNIKAYFGAARESWRSPDGQQDAQPVGLRPIDVWYIGMPAYRTPAGGDQRGFERWVDPVIEQPNVGGNIRPVANAARSTTRGQHDALATQLTDWLSAMCPHRLTMAKDGHGTNRLAVPPSRPCRENKMARAGRLQDVRACATCAQLQILLSAVLAAEPIIALPVLAQYVGRHSPQCGALVAPTHRKRSSRSCQRE